MQTIKHQFHARRYSQFIEDAEQVVANDAGSNLIGFVLGFFAIECFRARAVGDSRAILFPFVAAAVPILDLLAAVVRRVRARRSPAFGDRSHLYDKLLARGWPAGRVTLAYYVAAGASVLVACYVLQAPPNAGSVAAAVCAAAVARALIHLGCLEMENGPAETPGAVEYEENPALENVAAKDAAQRGAISPGD